MTEEFEQPVMAAAREERAARAALEEGIGPLHPSWREHHEAAYQARLRRWRTASRTLVDALNRLRDASGAIEESGADSLASSAQEPSSR